MKYIARNERIPQDRRRELNDKILYLIDAGMTEATDISREDIYNAYTGDGGLHGLKRSDYDSYSEYSDLSAVNGDKLTFLAVCGKEAVAKGLKAGDLVKLVCSCCGGSGGGKPDSAMGGGKDINKLDDALALVDNFVASKLN